MTTGGSFWRGLADMRRQPMAQICTLLTVCMVAFMAGAGLLLLYNVQEEVLRTEGQARFQIYWSESANMTAVQQQWADLKDLPGAAKVQTFTPGEALGRIMHGLGATGAANATAPDGAQDPDAQNAPAAAAQESGAKNATQAAPGEGGADVRPAEAVKDDFSWLAGENPLPPTALVEFDIPPGESPEPWMGRMYARLHNMEGVERVTYDATQLSLAKGWIELIQASVLPALLFFALLVAFVVGNTMKLMLLTRRDEVEILELVGARSWFIRAPLFANGLAQGLGGGLLALGCLRLLQVWLDGLLDTPPLFLRVDFPPAWECFALVTATTFVAGLASLLAGRR